MLVVVSVAVVIAIACVLLPAVFSFYFLYYKSITLASMCIKTKIIKLREKKNVVKTFICQVLCNPKEINISLKGSSEK